MSDDYKGFKLAKVLTKEFIDGRQENLTNEDELIVKEVKKFMTKRNHNRTFLFFSRQNCNDMFIQMRFKDEMLSWSMLDKSDFDNQWDLGPFIYLTDNGACCYFSPHVNMKKHSDVNR